MNRITLESDRFGNYLVTHEDGREAFFQIDYDFPSLASHLGWNVSNVRQDHCHVTPGHEHDSAHTFPPDEAETMPACPKAVER